MSKRKIPEPPAPVKSPPKIVRKETNEAPKKRPKEEEIIWPADAKRSFPRTAG